ncbi:MAG: ZIP family metal transporter [Patescibacteria group bacterium]
MLQSSGMGIYLPILSVVVVSIISLVGVFAISFREDLIRKYIYLLVALAVGALLGDAFIHLIPEGLEQIGNPTIFSLLIIAGILLFFIIEKYLHWHHHYESADLDHAIHPLGKMILFSDGVHNFIDGLIIGSSYLVSPELGIATTIAVILHEIPQEIGDFGVLIHSGFSRTRALWFNFASALAAVLGVVIVLTAERLAGLLSVWLIPFAAGGFIYIALSDLIPELHKNSDRKSHALLQLLMIVVGIISMLLLLKLE